MLAIPFLSALILGLLLVRSIAPPFSTRPRWAGVVLDLSLAFGLGMGLMSGIFFLLLWAGAARYQLAVDGIVIAAAAFWYFKRKPPQDALTADPLPPFRWTWLLLVLGGVCLAFFAAASYLAMTTNPQGEWDAWAIWNLRAKFLATGEAAWRSAFSPLLNQTHPDYPLLLSGFVASCWTIAGDISFTAPTIVSFLFPLCAFGVLLGALTLARGLTTGILASFILFATGAYIGQASSQYSDLPLSFYFIAALSLLMLAQRFPQAPSLCVLAGVAAGMGAWTKNEGWPFLVLAFISALVFLGRAATIRFAAGAAPFALIAAAFKLFLAPGIEPLTRQGSSAMLAKLASPDRYLQILGSFWTGFLEAGFPASHPIVIFAILAALLGLLRGDEARKLRLVALPAIGMLAVYFAAFLFSTDDLKWHLDTASERLLMQIWPGLVLLGMLALKRPEDRAVVEAPARKQAKRER